jgi:hypothetical protein
VKRSIFGAPQSKKLMEARLARILADDQAAQRSAAARLATAAKNPISSCRMAAVKLSLKEPPATSQLTKVTKKFITRRWLRGTDSALPDRTCRCFRGALRNTMNVSSTQAKGVFVVFGAKLLTSA